MTVAEAGKLRYTKFFTIQDFFFENKSISLPIKPSDFGQGSSKIVPRRLSSSKILFSLFAILVYFFYIDMEPTLMCSEIQGALSFPSS